MSSNWNIHRDFFFHVNRQVVPRLPAVFHVLPAVLLRIFCHLLNKSHRFRLIEFNDFAPIYFAFVLIDCLLSNVSKQSQCGFDVSTSLNKGIFTKIASIMSQWKIHRYISFFYFRIQFWYLCNAVWNMIGFFWEIDGICGGKTTIMK